MNQPNDPNGLLPISQFVRSYAPLIVKHCEANPGELDRLLSADDSRHLFGLSSVSFFKLVARVVSS